MVSYKETILKVMIYLNKGTDIYNLKWSHEPSETRSQTFFLKTLSIISGIFPGFVYEIKFFSLKSDLL